MYKIEGNTKDGYVLMRLGVCGLWIDVSKHDSRQRADEALLRQKQIRVMQKSWGDYQEID